jgi:pyridoxine 5-phosphate synthase
MKTNLSVNINKVALIRNGRGGNLPDLVQVAKDCERFGAEGITVHPRPDQRHIRYDDIAPLKAIVQTEFNIEGNPVREFMDLVLAHPPHQCTLVPDKPSALTSTEGWDTINNVDFLTETIQELRSAGIRVSIFLNADEKLVAGAKAVGADRIEFYTGDFARNYGTAPGQAIIEKHARCAELAHQLGLGVNAGHDLNLDNLRFYKNNMPYLSEVSIGHALISDTLYLGLETTIGKYLECLK